MAVDLRPAGERILQRPGDIFTVRVVYPTTITGETFVATYRGATITVTKTVNVASFPVTVGPLGSVDEVVLTRAVSGGVRTDLVLTLVSTDSVTARDEEGNFPLITQDSAELTATVVLQPDDLRSPTSGKGVDPNTDTAALIGWDFNPISYGRHKCWTFDEFFAANTVASGIGQHGWTGTTANSGAIADGALGPRGAVSLSTGTASASGSAKIEHPRISALDLDQTVDVSHAFKVQIGAASTAQAYLAEVGVKANATTHGAFFRITGGSTITVAAVCNDGSNETVTALADTTAGTWEHFEVRQHAADSWRFYRNGELVATITTHQPDLAVLLPRAGITKTNGTGTARTLVVDRYDYVNHSPV